MKKLAGPILSMLVILMAKVVFAPAWAGPDAGPAGLRPVESANVGPAFFDLMDLSTPGLEKVKAHVEKKEFAQALDAWRDQVVDKLRGMDFGEFYPWLGGPLYLKLADKLVGKDVEGVKEAERVFTFSDPYKFCGPPDPTRKIAWFPGQPDPWDNRLCGILRPLVIAYYLNSRDEIYLTKWFQVMNDWAVNHKRGYDRLSDEEKKSLTMSWRWWIGAGAVLHMAVRADEIPRQLAAFAKALPDGKKVRPWGQALSPVSGELPAESRELMPSDQLANIVLCLMFDHPPILIQAYKIPRGTPNQRLAGLFGLALIGEVFSEFKQARVCAEAADYGINDYLGATVLADGGDSEQSFNYNEGLLVQALILLKVFANSTNPPAWVVKFQDMARRRARLFAGLSVPVGFLPKTGTYGCPAAPALWKDKKIEREWKAYLYSCGSYLGFPRCDFGDPVVAQIFDVLWGPGDKDPPPFTSVAFPYSGYYALRDKWDMTNSLYLFLCSPRKGSGHANEMINSIQVTAYGRHLLVSCSPTPYIPEHLPEDQRADFRAIVDYVGEGSSLAHNTIIVDGASQRRTYNLNPSVVYPDPIHSRWHSSEFYDLAEGAYTNGYGSKWLWEGNSSSLVPVNPVAACRHDRQIVFIRKYGFWIVTDRLSGDGKAHQFGQLWHFPPPVTAHHKGKTNNVPGFLPAQVKTNGKDKWIRTRDPDGPNIALNHITLRPMQYITYYGQTNPVYRGWYSEGIAGRCHPAVEIESRWSGSGDQLLVTIISPFHGTQPPFRMQVGIARILEHVGLTHPARGSLRNLCRKDGDAVSGFEAVMDDGAIITYQVVQKEGRIKAGDISMIGEALLVERQPDGIERGLALGCREFTLAGRPQKIDKPDFEFVRKGDAVEIVAPIRYQDESP